MQLTIMMVSLCCRILWLALQCTVNTLAVLDALGRYGVFGIVGTQWNTGDSTANEASDTVGDSDVYAGGKFDPPLKGLSAYVQNVKNHPALLGYYLFDVKAERCSLIVCLLACPVSYR